MEKKIDTQKTRKWEQEEIGHEKNRKQIIWDTIMSKTNEINYLNENKRKITIGTLKNNTEIRIKLGPKQKIGHRKFWTLENIEEIGHTTFGDAAEIMNTRNERTR